MITIFNNKESLLYLKPRLSLTLLLLIITISTLIIIGIKVKIYDTYKTKGIISCTNTCIITTYIPTSINPNKIKFNNKEINYLELKKEIEVDEENYISYYKIIYDIKDNFDNNEIVNLNFYYNKQSIIRKIFSKVFRKEG